MEGGLSTPAGKHHTVVSLADTAACFESRYPEALLPESWALTVRCLSRYQSTKDLALGRSSHLEIPIGSFRQSCPYSPLHLTRLLGELETYAPGPCLVDLQHWDVVQASAVDLVAGFQLSCSLNGGGVDAEMATLGLESCAIGSALAFDALQLPSRHLFEFGLSGGTGARQYCEQKVDIIIPLFFPCSQNPVPARMGSWVKISSALYQ